MLHSHPTILRNWEKSLSYQSSQMRRVLYPWLIEQEQSSGGYELLYVYDLPPHLFDINGIFYFLKFPIYICTALYVRTPAKCFSRISLRILFGIEFGYMCSYFLIYWTLPGFRVYTMLHVPAFHTGLFEFKPFGIGNDSIWHTNPKGLNLSSHGWNPWKDLLTRATTLEGLNIVLPDR